MNTIIIILCQKKIIFVPKEGVWLFAPGLAHACANISRSALLNFGDLKNETPVLGSSQGEREKIIMSVREK